MKPLILLLLGIFLLGCETSLESPATTPDAAPPTRDNTIINRRDQNTYTTTPLDQSADQADVDLTARIRQEVIAANLSINAQNIKIITDGGRVTLRGPVQSAEEKARIEQLATTIAGAGNVDNQLEVNQ